MKPITHPLYDGSTYSLRTGEGNSLQPWLSEVVLEVAALRVRHYTGSNNSSDHPLLTIIDAHAAISARSIANCLG